LDFKATKAEQGLQLDWEDDLWGLTLESHQ